MVDYVPTSVEEEEEVQHQDSLSKNPKPPIDPFDSSFTDFSFVDSLLDFNFIQEFFEDTDTDTFELDSEKKIIMEMGDKESCIDTPPSEALVTELTVIKEEPVEPCIETPPSVGVVSELTVFKEEPVESCTETPSSVAAVSELIVQEEPVESCIETPSSVAAVSELIVQEEPVESCIEAPSSVAAVSELIVQEAPLELEKEGDSGNLGVSDSSIEEELGRFSLVGSSDHSADELVVQDDQILIEETSPVAPVSSVASDGGDCGNDGSSSSSSGGDDESSDSESSSSSASSSSSSSDDDTEEEEEEVDDNEEEKEVGGEIEEGEIRDVVNREKKVCNSDDEESEDVDKMVEWSDDDDEFGGHVNEEEDVKGPIKSKNEVVYLPTVPPVDATLQPHHQMLPVGIVLSTLGAQVIVEGTEKHDPLNEGSVLWITEKRSPLGLVDEIFGPVQNPYYVVRFNSEAEVPAEIHQGTLVSFVAEYAQHVLSENLRKKGYDASGEHDEEVSDDEEFSDDEKEAEHKRMQRMSKRVMNQQTSNDSRRKIKNRNRNRNGNGNGNDSMPSGAGQQQYNQNQQQNQQPYNHNQQNAATAVAATPGASFCPPFRPMVPAAPVIFQPPNRGWINPMPPQQQNAAFIPGGFSGNNMPWPAQNQPFQQPFNFNQGPVPNGVFPGGQMNPFPNGPPPWQAMPGQNCFNPSFLGMGFQMQQPPNPPVMNFGQGMMFNQPQVQQNHSLPPPHQPQVQQNHSLPPPQAVPFVDIRPPQQFNSGASSGRGSRPYQRGGSRGRGRGRFSGGRGR